MGIACHGRLHSAHTGLAASKALHSAAVCFPPLALSLSLRTRPRAFRQSMQAFQELKREPPHFVHFLVRVVLIGPDSHIRLGRIE